MIPSLFLPYLLFLVGPIIRRIICLKICFFKFLGYNLPDPLVIFWDVWGREIRNFFERALESLWNSWWIFEKFIPTGNVHERNSSRSLKRGNENFLSLKLYFQAFEQLMAFSKKLFLAGGIYGSLRLLTFVDIKILNLLNHCYII